MKILPFYTSTAQRDAERVSSRDALLCPRHKLLPWQIQRDHLATTYLSSLALVDCDGSETDIFDYVFSARSILTSWTNGAGALGYNTFTASDIEITSAIATGGDSDFCYSNAFTLATGDALRVDYSFALTTGDLPTLYLGNPGVTYHSTGVSMATGINTAYLHADANNSGTTRLMVVNQSGDDTEFACDFWTILGKNTLEVDEFTSYDFITYNGNPLNQLLPYGVYYLKASDGNTDWYSEWFSIRDLQTNVIPAQFTNVTYDTFTNSYNAGYGTNITSAIELTGTAYANSSSTFAVKTGERLLISYDLGALSGQVPSFVIEDADAYDISNVITCEVGIHEAELIVTASTATAHLHISNSGVTNFQMTSISLRRKSGDYIFLEYTNTKDIQGAASVLYQNGFTQQIYLDAILNNPQHEMTESGEEKDGVFQPEKLVDKLIYNIVAYVSRSTLKALRLLPMHDDIEITDEVGNLYTPSVGNVRVTWDGGFDTYTLRIDFNEEGDVWTSNMDNIT